MKSVPPSWSGSATGEDAVDEDVLEAVYVPEGDVEDVTSTDDAAEGAEKEADVDGPAP